MIDFESFSQILDEIANSLPKEIYIELNGGINLLPDCIIHPESEDGKLFVLGDYNYNHLGRYINIYYGSFVQTYRQRSDEELLKKIAHTLKHEFIHHLESMAGEKGLEIADAEFLSRYKASLSE